MHVMAETSLARLQKQVTKYEQRIIKLEDALAQEREEKQLYKLRYEQLQKNFDDKVEEIVKKAVAKAVEEVKKGYEKEIEKREQRIFELENRLNINSSNSSLPSSMNPLYQERICNSREKSNKSKGGQFGHKKHQLEPFQEEEITEHIEHKQNTCPNCMCQHLEKIEKKIRDELDFRVVVEKKRHLFYVYRCPDCGAIIESKIPLNLHAPNQYGANTKAMILSLADLGFVSYNRSRKFIYGMSNQEINPSEGYMVKLQRNAAKQLEDFLFDAKEEILKSKQVGWDDTVIAIADKDKACLRVYTNGNIALYKAHMSKDTTGMDEDAILQNLPKDTIVIHDHLLHNYCDEYQYQNAECNAHISRKAKSVKETTSHKWAEEFLTFQKEIYIRREENIKKKITSFTTKELKEIWKRYDDIIEEGLIECEQFKHKFEYEKEENLLEFLRDFKESILFWVKDYTVSYSNNLCETLLRFTKSKMKISYRFQSLENARSFAAIHTYTETCGRFGKNKYEALSRLMKGDPYTISGLIKEKMQSENQKNNQN